MRVDIWSDVVCPWCYIGKRRFEQALAAFPHADEVEVVFRSFQLDPSFPEGQTRPTVEVLAEKYGVSVAETAGMMQRAESVASADGLEYHLATTISGNTFDAHRVLHLARERGAEPAVVERLFRAYFTENRSLFDHETLAQLASEAGLGADDVKQVLASDAYAADVRADIAEAHTLGITGVPFFAIDMRYGVSGAQPVALLTQALAQAWQARGDALDLEDGDACTDDCCAPSRPAAAEV